MLKSADHGPRNQKIHFPGLNGLRFFAAFAVLLHHVEQIKWFQGLPNRWGISILTGFGDQGVNFFFTLSGFLITYLLFHEQRSGGIRIKEFYLRRILRIWPLYYFITFLGFFVFPYFAFLKVQGMPATLETDFASSLLGYIFFSAHVTELYIGPVVFASALWSTSVEEHFYLLWPPLLRLCKEKFHFALFAIIGVWVGIRFSDAWGWSYVTSEDLRSALHSIAVYCHLFRIDCMAVGGLGAWIYAHKPAYIKYLFSIPVQVLMYSILAYRLWHDMRLAPLANEYNCALFMFIIFNVTMNPKSLLKLENRPMDFLGKISFGIYAFNWVVITAWINFLNLFDGPFDNLVVGNLLVYCGSSVLVCAVATLSYIVIEKPFLQLKKRYSYARDSLKDVAPPDHGPALPS